MKMFSRESSMKKTIDSCLNQFSFLSSLSNDKMDAKLTRKRKSKVSRLSWKLRNNGEMI